MIGMANDGAKRTSITTFHSRLAHSLSQTSDCMIGVPFCKSYCLGTRVEGKTLRYAVVVDRWGHMAVLSGQVYSRRRETHGNTAGSSPYHAGCAASGSAQG